MDNSLETKKAPPKRGADAPSKGKPKTILIDKQLKIKDLHNTAIDRASGPTTKPNPKPRIASAEKASQAADAASYAALRPCG